MTAFFPISKKEFAAKYPLSYATLALVPDCIPENREQIAVITAQAQTVLEVEILGAEGITLEGFDFVWVEVDEPQKLDFFGNQVGGASTYPVLIHRNITTGLTALTVRLKELELIPGDATAVALIELPTPGTVDDEHLF